MDFGDSQWQADDSWRTQTDKVKVEAYDATNRRKNSRGAANLVEVASEEPLFVDGTELDPRPAPGKIHMKIIHHHSK